ncbi:hypothetical protein Aocu_14240 [Acholeplasma oculi]|uniref:Uncharacterized protein n=1 Tax=Acholeplasma oculi TaxID=35623 RepID=A0A061AKD5_9MOLU|nr:hypothetical protein Aocu_14240 [Acholeplasma oculi]
MTRIYLTYQKHLERGFKYMAAPVKPAPKKEAPAPKKPAGKK